MSADAKQGFDGDVWLRERVRADLPPAAFARHPWRLVLMAPLVGSIVAASLAVVVVPWPWYAALPVSVAIGCLYTSLFFFGHEVAHGAVVRAPWLRDAVLYVTCLVYGISPHLWVTWHNSAHHGHTNMGDRDPDSFGTLEHWRRTPMSRILAPLAPGSGHWLSVLYLPTFFTLHSQGILWFNSYSEDFRDFRRRRAKLDSLAMVVFWIVMAMWAGPRGTLFAIVIPMLTLNFVMMSYVVTNHMLRPLVAGQDSLATTMSVSTLPPIDLLFFHFSHHVEHHLFPAMSPRYYPLVRRSLRRHVGDRYLAPPHWRAMLLVFRTPRVYEDARTLVDPRRDRRVPLDVVTRALERLTRR